MSQAISPSQTPASSNMQPSCPPVQAMMQMITGYWVAQAIHVAAKLNIADHLGPLDAAPQAISSLAEKTCSNTDFLYRTLRALCGVGIFREHENRAFSNTVLSEYLKTDHPQSLNAMAIMMGEEHYQAWGQITHSVKTGSLAFPTVYGMPVFEYFEKHPESGEIFNKAMTGFNKNIQLAVPQIYDFSRFETLVDVGGGHGTLLAGILKAYPNLKGVLFDLPHVASGAQATFDKAGVAERVKVAGGNFFNEVPIGGDAYLLSTVIHDWSDELANQILRQCHEAMVKDGILLLVEHVIQPDNRLDFAKFLDLNMMVMTPGGRERSQTEFEKLLKAAGFALTQIIDTPVQICIVEAKRI